MDFTDILQSIKNEKNVKCLKCAVALDPLRTIWQLVGLLHFFYLPGQTKLRSSFFCDNGWHVRL